MLGQGNSAAESASVDAVPDGCCHGNAELPTVSRSDAAQPKPLERSVPGRDMLLWSEWLGKRVGISGQNLLCATKFAHIQNC